MYLFIKKDNSSIFGLYGTIKKAEKALIENDLNIDDFKHIECDLNDSTSFSSFDFTSKNIDNFTNDQQPVLEFTANEINTIDGVLEKPAESIFLVKVFLS